MTGWRMVPEGIGKILTDTQAHAQELGASIGTLSDAVEQVRAGSGFDGVVLTAFTGFLEDQGDRLAGVMNRVGAGLEATAASTAAYLDGSEEIAATMIAGTEHAASTGEMTGFAGVLGE